MLWLRSWFETSWIDGMVMSAHGYEHNDMPCTMGVSQCNILSLQQTLKVVMCRKAPVSPT